MSSEPHEFSPQQIEFLAQFADNARLGRRFLCSFVHLMSALGVVIGIAAGVRAWFQH